MRKNTFVPLMAIALVGAPLAAAAQAVPHGDDAHPESSARAGFERTPMHSLERFQAELGLSADQLSRLEAIGQRLQEQNRPLVAQLRESDAWRQRGDRQARAGSGSRARAEATPEQREQMRQRMGNMSPEQREQMRQRMENMSPEQREQRRQRGDRAGMAFGQREVPADLRPVVEQIRANARAAHAEARAVLTPEQQERVRELTRRRMARTDRPGDFRQFRRGGPAGR